MRRQRVLANFGEFVLDHEGHGELDKILTEGCRLIAEALDTDLAKVIQIEPERASGFVRAGIGWNEGIVGKERISLSERSSEAYAIARAAPVITNDIAAETRFHFPAFLRDHGVIALVNVPIFLTGRRAWGVLQVDAREPREFDRDDIEFLMTYAMVLGPVVDRMLVVVEREEARRRLAERNDRLRRVVDGIEEGFGLLAPDFTILEDNRKLSPPVSGDPIGRSFWEVYPQAKGSELGRMLERAMDERVPLALEHRPEGSDIWLDTRAFPVADGSLAVLWRDATRRREARERIRKSEEWLRSAVEVGKVGLWDWDVRADTVVWSNEHWKMYGYEPGEVEPSYEAWIESIHEDDRARADGELRRAMETGEDYSCEFRVIHPDGTIRWLQGNGRFFFGDEGQPVRMVGAMVDYTEAREMQDRLGIMVAELQHRTRNLIGVVKAMADRTVRGSASLAGFEAKFRARLDAMARVQGMLSRLGSEDRIAFDELIASEIAALNGDAAQAQVRLDGPRGVKLRSATVQTLALALHELATNALKYGALGEEGARLAVRWSVERRGEDRKRWLNIDWRESGVSIPAESEGDRRAGDGRDLIENALPYQLGARTSLEFGPDGVHCTIALPLPRDKG
ncbi:PAS domain-containing protein [Erythrobacter sp.]|uniref:PAS domain-containing protein n=1 Tax=Erythrobacter sp. TaxID=1042 RepID=UPI001425F1D4|nr:PAS domain-containing protein [Erythrobacter sp.]QIQ86554.1 MAG: PAS domain-containing protein [Erythrobacter sp.]